MDLNHRPLGYEGTYRNRNCPLIALVGAWPTALPQDVSCQADCSRAEVAEVDTNFYRVKIEVQQPAIDSKGVNNRKPKNRNTRATCYQNMQVGSGQSR